MAISIYSIGFVVSLLALIAWFYFEKNRTLSSIFRTLVFLGLIAFVVGAFSHHASIEYTTKALMRDFLVMGMTGTLFYLLSKQNFTITPFLAIAITVLSYYYHENVLEPTFENIPVSAEVNTSGIQSNTLNTGNLKLDENFELLVEVSEGHQFNELDKISSKYGLSFEKAFHPLETDITDLDDYVAVNIPTDQLKNLGLINKELMASGLIDWVETNEMIQIDDPSFTNIITPAKKNFGLNDPGVSKLWGFDAMKVDELYSLLKSKKVKPKKKALIAILDTGVDAAHEDIKGNFKSIEAKSDVDKNGHGTHCAGIAGAVSNNKTGVASLSQNNEFVQVTSVKVLMDFGGGTQAGIIRGMIKAADKGADVISMSLGGKGNPAANKAYQKAVDYIIKKGAILVVAAGNSKANAKDFVPAGLDNVIAVAAIDESLKLAPFSNHVEDVKMGVAAPGANIYSTFPNNEYKSFNGTSMACPYVAGLVGLLKSIKPSLTPNEAYKLLQSTGVKVSSSKGKLINPKDAVKKLL